MGIICNGIYTSGNHALLKTIGLFGHQRLAGAITQWDFNINHHYDDTYFKQNGGEIVEVPKKRHKALGSQAYHLPHTWVEENLGDRYVLAHYPGYRTKHKQIVIIRDPRNTLISRWRKIWTEKPPTRKGTGWRPFLKYDLTGKADHDLPFLLKNMNVVDETFKMAMTQGLKIKYEELLWPQTRAVDKITTYLDKEPIDSKKIIGKTYTWSGNPSSWEKYWNEELDKIFTDLGGHELLGKLNYDH